ncbi:MAG: trypsin-like serine protease [Desulfobulbaceae bacterium]|nr:trypsin-like serine protease [Desulfobulbaceae bacterium]
MRLLFSFSLVLLLTWTIPPAGAHEIHLKNGQVIKSNALRKEDGRLIYQRYGGTITIDLDRVKKIVYDQSAAGLPAGSGARQAVANRNLAEQMRRALNPQTPVEEANMATVFIETAAGSGSGFFISSDGLIVTNRHVVRGSEENNRRIEEDSVKINVILKNRKQQLENDRARIKNYAKLLKRQWRELAEFEKKMKNKQERQQAREVRATLSTNERSLKDWKKQYQKNLVEYQQAATEFRHKRGEHTTRQKKLTSQSHFPITLADGTKKWAALYRISDQLDLALLKLNDFTTPFLVPQKERLPQGTPIYAIGSPLNLKGTVTSGVLSSYRGQYIQTNAEIYPGNSGGPLVSEEGRVIGVNTMKMITEKFEGLGFAIRIEAVQQEFANYL